MKKTNYYIKARLFPTIICSIPILSLYFFAFSKEVQEFIGFVDGYKWASDITISVALIYLLVQINRFISKEIFQRIYFKDEKQMPTTNYLLNSDKTLALSIKQQIRSKINSDFNIIIQDKEIEDNDDEERKQIINAVAQIRNNTRGNVLLLQHNIEFGFMRNLIGSSLLAFLISGFSIYYFHELEINLVAFKINTFLSFIYLIPVLFSKLIIGRYGHYYAKVLFEQYLK